MSCPLFRIQLEYCLLTCPLFFFNRKSCCDFFNCMHPLEEMHHEKWQKSGRLYRLLPADWITYHPLSQLTSKSHGVSPLPPYSTHCSTTSNHHPLRTTTITSISIHANNSTTTIASISINANNSINTSWCPNFCSDFPQTLGAYIIEIEVGTPPISQLMIIGTGSDVTWFQCKPCNYCLTPGVFDPLVSTSILAVPCDSIACNYLDWHSCNMSQCQYEVDYLDSSFTKGMLVLEILKFESTGIQNVFFGCGHSNNFMLPAIHSLVGLGGGPLSLPTQLGLCGLAGMFNCCLPGSVGGSLGWLNFSVLGVVPHAGTAWIPLLPNPKKRTYYFVGLSGLGIGDMHLSIPESSFIGGGIIDSSTTYTHLTRLVYEAFHNAYLAKTVNLPRAPVNSLFDTCYNLSGIELIQVPNVSFFFSAELIITLKGRNVLVKQEGLVGVDIFCFAFILVNYTTIIIGNTQLAGI